MIDHLKTFVPLCGAGVLGVQAVSMVPVLGIVGDVIKIVVQLAIGFATVRGLWKHSKVEVQPKNDKNVK